MQELNIHIPVGIRFECSGCGNCCFSWPVPVTASDRERIRQQVGSDADQYFLAIRNQADILERSVYTYTLEKRADGSCFFLTAENRCHLQAQFGPEVKPSMCRLFPFTFTRTPEGVFAYVSFASSAVLFNSGRLLSEQSQTVSEQWRLFQELYSNQPPDWSAVQLVDGVPLPWTDYLQLERQLFALFQADENDSMAKERSRLESQLRRASQILVSAAPPDAVKEKSLTEARPKIVDQILVKHLLAFYFPDDVFAYTARDLPIHAIAESLVKPPDAVSLSTHGSSLSFQQIFSKQLGRLDAQSEDLLFRFVYCRIFSKLYFGPGFQNLSLVVGFHHLLLLIALVRLFLKCQLILTDKPPDFLGVAEAVRVLERRLTMTAYLQNTCSALEVLLSSQARLERILSLSA